MKFLDANEVASTAAWSGPKPNAGVLPVTPHPTYNLPRPTGLLNPGEADPIIQVAPTPPNLRASLFER